MQRRRCLFTGGFAANPIREGVEGLLPLKLPMRFAAFFCLSVDSCDHAKNPRWHCSAEYIVSSICANGQSPGMGWCGVAAPSHAHQALHHFSTISPPGLHRQMPANGVSFHVLELHSSYKCGTIELQTHGCFELRRLYQNKAAHVETVFVL